MQFSIGTKDVKRQGAHRQMTLAGWSRIRGIGIHVNVINPDTRVHVWSIFPNEIWLIDCYWQDQQPHIEVLLMPMIHDKGVNPNQKSVPCDQRWLSPKQLACHDDVWHVDKICFESISSWSVPVITNPIPDKVMVFMLITRVISRLINSPYG